MTRAAGVVLAVASGFVISACGQRANSALAPYLSATLTPGAGLGEIRLGSPVKAFIDRFGTGRVSVVAGDELLAADLRFPGDGLGFRFIAQGECLKALAATHGASRALMGIVDTKSFLTRYPPCALMPLQSIGIDGANHSLLGGYSGATASGTKIGSTRAELFAHEQPPVENRAAATVLDSPDDNDFEQFTFGNGLVAFVRRDGSDATAPAAAQWKVQKLAVFVQDDAQGR
jgi:hypothetical protein